MAFHPSKDYAEPCDIIKDLADSCDKGYVKGGTFIKKEVKGSGNIHIEIWFEIKPDREYNE
jgi:hypothetical protein